MFLSPEFCAVSSLAGTDLGLLVYCGPRRRVRVIYPLHILYLCCSGLHLGFTACGQDSRPPPAFHVGSGLTCTSEDYRHFHQNYCSGMSPWNCPFLFIFLLSFFLLRKSFWSFQHRFLVVFELSSCGKIQSQLGGGCACL